MDNYTEILCKSGVNGDTPTEIGISDLIELRSRIGKELTYCPHKKTGNRIFLLAPVEIARGLEDYISFLPVVIYGKGEAVCLEYGEIERVRIVLLEDCKSQFKSLNGKDTYDLFATLMDTKCIKPDTVLTKDLLVAEGNSVFKLRATLKEE